MFGETFNPEITWSSRNVLVSVCAKFRFEDELKRRLPCRSVEGACWCDDQRSPALPRVSISPFLRGRAQVSVIAKGCLAPHIVTLSNGQLWVYDLNVN